MPCDQNVINEGFRNDQKERQETDFVGGHDNVLSFILPITGSFCGV